MPGSKNEEAEAQKVEMVRLNVMAHLQPREAHVVDKIQEDGRDERRVHDSRLARPVVPEGRVYSSYSRHFQRRVLDRYPVDRAFLVSGKNEAALRLAAHVAKPHVAELA